MSDSSGRSWEGCIASQDLRHRVRPGRRGECDSRSGFRFWRRIADSSDRKRQARHPLRRVSKFPLDMFAGIGCHSAVTPYLPSTESLCGRLLCQAIIREKVQLNRSHSQSILPSVQSSTKSMRIEAQWTGATEGSLNILHGIGDPLDISHGCRFPPQQGASGIEFTIPAASAGTYLLQLRCLGRRRGVLPDSAGATVVVQAESNGLVALDRVLVKPYYFRVSAEPSSVKVGEEAELISFRRTGYGQG